jgi:hypothetical protein
VVAARALLEFHLFSPFLSLAGFPILIHRAAAVLLVQMERPQQMDHRAQTEVRLSVVRAAVVVVLIHRELEFPGLVEMAVGPVAVAVAQQVP